MKGSKNSNNKKDMASILEEQLCRVEGISKVAVVYKKRKAPLARYHTNDLFIDMNKVITTSIKNTYEHPNESHDESSYGKMSFSSGEALNINPNAPVTLPEMLMKAASLSPDRGIVYVLENGKEIFHSYVSLFEEAQRICKGLQQLNLKSGDPVIFQFKHNENFIPAFWGCVLGGFLPTPLAVPPVYTENNSAVKKLYNTWTLLEKPLVITEMQNQDQLIELTQLWNENKAFVTNIEDLRENDGELVENRFVATDLVLNLLTSGSTGIPKCVQHSHQSLISRIQATIQFNQFHRQDVTLSWMPLDHVGGIVMFHLLSVYLGCSQVVATIQSFIDRPTIWLDWIERFRASISWAPNFAYTLVNEALEQPHPRQWDLSSIRHILNGGEAIVSQNIRKFLQLLEQHKLPADCIFPSYGMSETSSGIVFSCKINRNKEHDGIHYLNKSTIRSKPYTVSADHINAIAFTEVGKPIPGVAIRIVNEHNQLLQEGWVGRLQVKGPTIMSGYYKNPEANAEVFCGDEWFNTGDLGFIIDGKLTITGREKDMIIINGQNHYNYEIEAFVQEVPGVEVTFSAACSIAHPSGTGDQLVIFFVPAAQTLDSQMKIAMRIREHLIRKVGIDPTYILPISKKDFPKTDSGKVQRAELDKKFINGDFDEIIKKIDLHFSNENTIPDWMYRMQWNKKNLLTTAGKRSVSGTTVIFSDSCGLVEEFLSHEWDRNNFIQVQVGQRFEKLNENVFRMNPKLLEDYYCLFSELTNKGVIINEIIHLWNYDEVWMPVTNVDALREAQFLGSYSLLFLAKALSRYAPDHSIRFTVVASRLHGVLKSDEVSFEKSTLVGILKTMEHELTDFSFKLVDVYPSENADYRALAQTVRNEFFNYDDNHIVAFRNGERYVPVLKKINPLHSSRKPLPFVKGGLYLITGGLGGIGKQVAAHLLDNYNAKLLIIGRTPLPERRYWNEIAQQNNKLAERIQHLLELESQAKDGAFVAYHATDLCDANKLKQIINDVEQSENTRFSGVIHLAGILHEERLADASVEKLEEMYEAKVYGTFVLTQLLKGQKEALFVSSSSVTTLSAPMMLGAYCSANTFLETFSSFQRQTLNMDSRCFSWSLWDGIGMSRETAFTGATTSGYLHITNKLGMFSLLSGLKTGHSQIYVGLDGTHPNIQKLSVTKSRNQTVFHAFFKVETGVNEHSVQLELDEAAREYFVQENINSESFHFESDFMDELPLLKDGSINKTQLKAVLSSNNGNVLYAEPRTSTEQVLVGIWSKLLKVGRIGVLDNFFVLGGHSLKAIQLFSIVRQSFGVDISFKELFSQPTIEGLAYHIDQAIRSLSKEIVHHSLIGEIPLSNAQTRQWVLYKLDPLNPAYNNLISLRLKGNLRIAELRKSIQALVDRHEILRTRYVEKEDSVYQIVEEQRVVDMQMVDLISLPFEMVAEKVEHIVVAEAHQLFDLSNGPVIRFKLLQIADDEHVLLISIHHIAFDGWSVEVLLQDLSALYQSFSTDDAPALRKLPVTYSDYAMWQNNWLTETQLESQIQYWKEQLQERNVPIIQLPVDFPRPSIQTYNGKTKEIWLDPELSQALYELSQKHNATLYMTMLSVFVTLLGRYTGQEEFVIGTIAANRNRSEIEGLLGCFVNTLALYIQAEGDLTFVELLDRIKRITIDAYDHQDVPFEKIVDALQIVRDPSHHVLFQVLFLLQNMPDNPVFANDLHAEMKLEHSNTSKFDLSFFVYEYSGRLSIAVEYNTDLFTEETIERMMANYQTLLNSTVKWPDKKLLSLPIISLKEQEQLQTFKYTGKITKMHRTISELFEEQAKKTPEQIAVRFENHSLTYDELNMKVNQLADVLRKRGVQRNQIVGICMERSVDMVVGILAILKAGGAYLPIDPSYPIDRIEFMLEDSESALLITQQGVVSSLSRFSGEYVYVDDPLLFLNGPIDIKSINDPHDLAYVIYTSGTTGRPKGVLIEHHNVIQLLFNVPFDFNEQDIWTMFHSFCFDFSVWEMYGALLFGGRLVVVPKHIAQDPSQFFQLLGEEKVTVLNQTPTYFTSLSNAILFHEKTGHCLRYVIFGGEALAPVHLKPFFEKYPDTKLINMFGITETTVHVTFKEITEHEIENNSSDIGSPIATLSVYVLDNCMNMLPVGIPGEMYVGGEGVARGYLNRPDLTQERFVPHAFKPGERLYRTGDLARWLPNGSLEYLGRIDHQVKIRGYRIEIGEIEARIIQNPSIKETVVVERANESNEKYLCAYMIGENSLDIESLRSDLKHVLPDYMIPAYFVFLEKFPITSNGKIDKKALPDPTNLFQLDQYAPPRNEWDRRLVEIWEEVLGLHRIGIKDSFFNLGGDSIKAIRLVSAMNNALHLSLQIRDIYSFSTIGTLVDKIQSQPAPQKQNIESFMTHLSGLKTRYLVNGKENEIASTPIDLYPMSDISKGMIFYTINRPEEAFYHDQFVYRLKDRTFDSKILVRSLYQMMEKHSILRSGFCLDEFSEPLQLVYPEVEVKIDEHLLTGISPEDQEKWISSYLSEDRKQAFEFSKPPLWRMSVAHLDSEHVCLLWRFHHSILDGWSVASFITELINHYFELKQDRQAVLPKLKSDTKDFIIDQHVVKTNTEIIDYWKHELMGYKRLSLLPFQEAESVNLEHTVIIDTLGIEVMNQVKALSKSCHVSVKNLCLTAFLVAINMFSYEDEVVVGVVENIRPVCDDGEKILGCFLNTVPFRMILKDEISYLDLIKQVNAKVADLKFSGRLSLMEVSKAVGETASSENPFFDVMFNFVDFHIYNELKQKGLESIVSIDMHHLYEKTNTLLDFTVSTTNEEWFIRVNTTFDEKAIRKLLHYYKEILDKMCVSPKVALNKAELLSDKERNDILYTFNASQKKFTEGRPIHSIFEEKVKETPSRVALMFKNETLTFEELNKKANQLAYALDQKGIGRNVIVGIMVERSFEMVIGILAILKAGGTYMPIDPDFPQDRISYMLEDSCAHSVLTQTKFSGKLTGITEDVILLDNEELYTGEGENLAVPQTIGDLAYVLYTSGSTGLPKGVMIEHGSLVNILLDMEARYPLQREDAYLLKTSFTFDVSATEIFGWIIGDGKLVILEPNAEKEPSHLLLAIDQFNISHINFVPSMLQTFFYNDGDWERLNKLKYVFAAGEALPAGLAMKVLNTLPQVCLENIYGPTEASIYSTSYSVTQWKSDSKRMPIGKPLTNYSAYILSSKGQIQPIHVPGELHIAGVGVARGYLNRDSLSNEKFIENHITQEGRMFKTGDLARWLPDGNIEYLGRIDHQVKVRGYRIETMEITAQMVKHPVVEGAVVLAKEREDGTNDLVCYIVSSVQWTSGELRSYLKQLLPEYMIPSYFVSIPDIPLNNNGKTDVVALKNLDIKAHSEVYVVPQDKLQEEMASVWCQVLGVSDIGIHDNFIELGGDSIKAIQIVSRFNALGHAILVKDIMVHRTIAELCEHIQTNRSWKVYDQGIIHGDKPMLPIDCWFFWLPWAEPGSYTQTVLLESREQELDLNLLEQAFDKLITHHDGLRLNLSEDGDRLYYNNNHLLKQFKIQIITVDSMQDAVYDNNFDLHGDLLLSAKYYKIPDGNPLLEISGHHLVVDGISWRILLEDLQYLYKKLLAEEPELGLPMKTASLQEWGSFQKEQAQSAELETKVELWNSILNTPFLIECDYETNDWSYQHQRISKGYLEPVQTTQLHKEALRVFHAEMDDLLLAALARTLKDWQGHEYIKIEVESHGRYSDSIDVSRTVGWLTSFHPVLINGQHSTTSELIKVVKRQLREVKENSSEYGLLSFLKKVPSLEYELPEIRFNYLGEFADAQNALFDLESFSAQLSKQNTFTAKLDITCQIIRGSFELQIAYSDQMFHENTINKIRDLYLVHLKAITSDAVNHGEMELSLSDFDAIDLDHAEFDSLFS
ncbi:hypothetical protein UB51_07420 [Paenibacillus sp. IHBB 10380]|nr:hypothetical protein UB51_07420 [Paenibacillus sp. IHBB 10380]